MPIYEYSCPQCGVGKDVMHKIAESPQVPCDHCEGQWLQRQVSAAAFRLKGGGWYETDFKKDGQRNLAGGDKADAASPVPASTPAAAETAASAPATKPATAEAPAVKPVPSPSPSAN